MVNDSQRHTNHTQPLFNKQDRIKRLKRAIKEVEKINKHGEYNNLIDSYYKQLKEVGSGQAD